MNLQLKKLGDLDQPTTSLQVLIKNLELTTRVNHGLRVTLHLDSSTQIIRNAKEKRVVAAALDQEEGERFEAHCQTMRFAAVGTESSVAFDQFCLRHASAGVLPLVRQRGSSRFLLFERDIAPMGWNIANGGSSTTSELQDVDALLRREASEEILFFEPEQQSLHALQTANLSDELDLALRLWSQELGAQRGDDFLWQAEVGADELRVQYQGRDIQTTTGLTIALNALDFGIECGRFIVIDVPESIVPLDGEILNGRLLDRRIGLFHDLQSSRQGRPQVLFQSGQKKAVSENRTTALCPVTQKMLGQFNADEIA